MLEWSGVFVGRMRGREGVSGKDLRGFSGAFLCLFILFFFGS